MISQVTQQNLIKALQTVLWHVEEQNEVNHRIPPAMCRLCYSHRQIMRDVLREANARCCAFDDPSPCDTCKEQRQ